MPSSESRIGTEQSAAAGANDYPDFASRACAMARQPRGRPGCHPPCSSGRRSSPRKPPSPLSSTRRRSCSGWRRLIRRQGDCRLARGRRACGQARAAGHFSGHDGDVRRVGPCAGFRAERGDTRWYPTAPRHPIGSGHRRRLHARHGVDATRQARGDGHSLAGHVCCWGCTDPYCGGSAWASVPFPRPCCWHCESDCLKPLSGLSRRVAAVRRRR